MPRRIIFGGPSEIYDDDEDYHPSLVQQGYGEHAAHNQDYYSYAGLGDGVAYAQEMPEEAQRGLTYNANEDMHEAWDRDGVPVKRRPGAMGSYWVKGALRREVDDDSEDRDDDEDDAEQGSDEEDGDDPVRRGYQVYLGSSLKQRKKGAANVLLEESLEDELVEEDGLPEHKYSYQCVEPGVISEHRYANAWDRDEEVGEDLGEDTEKGQEYSGRVYVLNNQGGHMAPCGDDKEHGDNEEYDDDDEEYGCNDICNKLGIVDSEDDDEPEYDDE